MLAVYSDKALHSKVACPAVPRWSKFRGCYAFGEVAVGLCSFWAA